MKIKATIDIIEVKEEPVFTTEVEVSSIEHEVARICSHLDPDRKYKIVVKPELPGLDPEKASCSFLSDLLSYAAYKSNEAAIDTIAGKILENPRYPFYVGGLK
jgi:hypothetical protein